MLRFCNCDKPQKSTNQTQDFVTPQTYIRAVASENALDEDSWAGNSP